MSADLNFLLEYQWHFLWGQPWRDTPPDVDRMFPCNVPVPWLKAGRKCRSPTPSPSYSPSVFMPELGPGAWKPNIASNAPQDNETVLIIARNRQSDAVHWLNEQPYRYVIMEKGLPAGTPNNLPENKGGDAASYMQFILEHWDRLPARMLFMHGHRHSWHNGVGHSSDLDCVGSDSDVTSDFM